MTRPSLVRTVHILYTLIRGSNIHTMFYFCRNKPLRQNDSMYLPGLHEQLAKNAYNAILLLVFLHKYTQGKTEFIVYFQRSLKLNVFLRILTDFCRYPLAKTEYQMFQLHKKKLVVERKGWNSKQGIRDTDMNITGISSGSSKRFFLG